MRRVAGERNSRSRLARGLATLALAPAILLLLASPANAHAGFVSSDPAAGTILPAAPRSVSVRFTEVIDAAQSELAIAGPDQRRLTGVATRRDPRDATRLTATLPTGLARGTYTVRWRVLSVDGHPVSSGFRFAIGAPSAALTTVSGSGDTPTALGGIGRGLGDAGLLSLLGLCAFAPLVVRPALGRLGRRSGRGPATESDVLRRLVPWQAAAAGCALVGCLVVAVDTVAQTRGISPGQALTRPHDMVSLLTNGRTGVLLGIRTLGLAALLAVLLAQLLLGRAARMALHLVLGAASAGLLLTISLSSHAAGGADRPVAVVLDWAHLLAAGVWIGGLLALALCGLASAKRLLRSDLDAAADTVAALTRSFATGAQVCMVAIAATGIYSVLVHTDGIREFGGSAWGVELTVKLALLATVLIVAGANTVSLVPRVSARAASLSARLTACGDLAVAVRLELALAGVLICVAAVLAGTAPPDLVV
ncbi:MAG TPA: copper resistance protein CopC [Frankiaceae bacterium]|nr:copper resistance protein CopC [Frankiaceae bacterium]